MENYKIQDKLRKSRECTYYAATNKLNNRPVTIQKLNSKRVSWEELLNRKDVALMKQGSLSCLPKLVEIIKDEGQFFMVLERLDNNLDEYRRTSKLPLPVSVDVAIKLLEALLELKKKEVVVTEIRPQHIFYDQGKVVLAVLGGGSRDTTKYDLLDSHDVRYAAPQNILTSKPADQRSSVFTIGCIVAELILNGNLIKAKSKMDYVYAITELFPKQHSPHKQPEQPKEVNHANSFEARISDCCARQLQLIIIDMLKINPTERIAVEDALDRLNKLDKAKLSKLATQPSEKTQQAERASLKSSTVQEIRKSKALTVVEPKVQPPPNNAIQSTKKTQGSRIDTKQSRKLPEITKPVTIEPRLKPPTEEPQPLNFQDHDDAAISRMLEMLKLTKPLRSEQNIDDDVTQAIIIKKSEAQELPALNVTQGRLRPARASLGRPQLTNFALNDGNLGVQLGSSFFSESDNAPF